jgi:hypothetical protein
MLQLLMSRTQAVRSYLVSERAGRPIFADDSGIRAITFQWVGRGMVVLGLSLVVALGLTLGAHVSLPGLDPLRSSDAVRRMFGGNGAEMSTTTTRQSDASGLDHVVAPRQVTPRVSTHSDGVRSVVGHRASPIAPVDASGPSAPATVRPMKLPAVAVVKTGPRPGVPGATRSATAAGHTKSRNPRAATPNKAASAPGGATAGGLHTTRRAASNNPSTSVNRRSSAKGPADHSKGFVKRHGTAKRPADPAP